MLGPPAAVEPSAQGCASRRRSLACKSCAVGIHQALEGRFTPLFLPRGPRAGDIARLIRLGMDVGRITAAWARALATERWCVDARGTGSPYAVRTQRLRVDERAGRAQSTLCPSHPRPFRAREVAVQGTTSSRPPVIHCHATTGPPRRMACHAPCLTARNATSNVFGYT